MNQALSMRFVERRGHLLDDFDEPGDRQSLSIGEDVRERAAIKKLHRQMRHPPVARLGYAKIGHIDDVRMAQAPSRFPLRGETVRGTRDASIGADG